jgi:argininosuccinate lyase
MKSWSGRFSKDISKDVESFNTSIDFDSRLYREDIKGSIEHAKMLARQDIISRDDAARITQGLERILDEAENGEIRFTADAEDIHMNIEKLLVEKIGEPGKKLHTARSRNDQVALDMRMYLRTEIRQISSLIKSLCSVLIKISENNLETIMPGYTHLQKAQPITLAHHLMAYVFMFIRDLDRLKDTGRRMNVMPLGSGALAASTYKLDRRSVQKSLDFDDITYNSLDAVSDRDFCLEMSFDLSVLMMHLSRFSEEIILWASREFSYIELDDSYCTGSSIMPQKKNPDVAELVRGKTGRTYGSLMALLTVMKGLPLAYNKDMQEDKEAIFDSIDTVKICLPVFTQMLDTARFNKDAMYKAAKDGYMNATDLADYLVRKGMAFRDAHEVTGKIVAYCISKHKTIEELLPDEMKSFSAVISSDVYDCLKIENCVYSRDLEGGPSPARVTEAIEIAGSRIRAL